MFQFLATAMDDAEDNHCVVARPVLVDYDIRQHDSYADLWPQCGASRSRCRMISQEIVQSDEEGPIFRGRSRTSLGMQIAENGGLIVRGGRGKDDPRHQTFIEASSRFMRASCSWRVWVLPLAISARASSM